jgi:GNAT superfamily N-acetyltransferase
MVIFVGTKVDKKMVQIRQSHEEDAEVIAGFQIKMALETENLILDPETVQQGVLNVYRNSAKGKYIVAAVEEQVIGSLLLTYEWSDWRNNTVVWIQSVYVLPEYRKHGVFHALYEMVKAMVNEDPSFAGIRLYVDRTNHDAQKVYTKSGMNGDHYQVFEWMK